MGTRGGEIGMAGSHVSPVCVWGLLGHDKCPDASVFGAEHQRVTLENKAKIGDERRYWSFPPLPSPGPDSA